MTTHGFSIAAILTLVALGGAAYFGYRAWNTEPELASGPLVAALNQARSAGERGNNLDAVFDKFVDNGLTIDERAPLLASEGFHCRIRQSELLPDNRILTCQRPLAGFCEGYMYYVYETASCEIFERSGTDYFVHENERSYSRCPARDPRDD